MSGHSGSPEKQITLQQVDSEVYQRLADFGVLSTPSGPDHDPTAILPEPSIETPGAAPTQATVEAADGSTHEASKRQAKKLGHTATRIARLEVTRDVHAEIPKALGPMVPSTKGKFTGPSPATQYRSTFREHNPDAQPFHESPGYQPGLRPVTRGELRQEARVGRRQSRANVIRSGEQFRLKKSWGNDIGTPAFEARIKESRLGYMEKRRAKKAHKKFLGLEETARHKEDLVRQSASGDDIPGSMITSRIDRTGKKQEKIVKRITGEKPRLNQRTLRHAKRASQSVYKKTRQYAKVTASAVRRGGRAAAIKTRDHLAATRQGYREGLSGTVQNQGIIQKQVDKIAYGSGKRLPGVGTGYQDRKRAWHKRQAENRRGVV